MSTVPTIQWSRGAVRMIEQTLLPERYKVITVRTVPEMWHAIKRLAEIPDKLPLLPETIIESIGGMKKTVLAHKSVSLDLEETRERERRWPGSTKDECGLHTLLRQEGEPCAKPR